MSITLKVAPNGRVCIPAAVRERLGVKEGGALFLDEEDGQYVLTSHAQRIRRIQEEVRAAMRGKPPYTVDDFIRDRPAMWGEAD